MAAHSARADASRHLNEHRAGTGEPLVLIHSSWRAWEPVVPALIQHHEVVAVDLPGFGDSPPLGEEDPPTAPRLADAVEEHLDTLGLGAVHVAGNDLGGWVALELARRGRARTVVAVAPLGLGSERENRRSWRRLARVRRMSRLTRPIVGPVARAALGRTLLGGGGLQLARPWRHEREAMVHTVRAFWLAPGFTGSYRWALTHRAEGLEAISCPVTIAWGTRDLIASPRQAERFAAAIPGAQVRLLKGLGHVPMSDDAELVARVLLDGATT